MIKKIVARGQTLALVGLFTPEENPHDVVDLDKQIHLYPSDTGLQRLRNLFRTTQNSDPVDPKVIATIHTGLATFIMAGIYGGFKSSRETFINFIEKNEATQFLNHLDAKRKLSDKMFTSFISGGVKWGLKVSYFCTIFTATYTAIAVYRNNDTVLYYTAGGMTAGAIYKIPLGPKGMISGGFFGAIFGTMYGSFKYLLLSLSKLTEADITNQKYGKTIERLDAVKNVYKEYLQNQAKEEIKSLMLDPNLGKK